MMLTDLFMSYFTPRQKYVRVHTNTNHIVVTAICKKNYTVLFKL